jgi:predicted kinase
VKDLYLVRGLPGSGKTTFAKNLTKFFAGIHFEADMFFERNGMKYKFDPNMLSDAHEWCQHSVSEQMSISCPVIVASNTFTTNREILPYVTMARAYGYKVTILTIESGLDPEALAARNVHGVPVETVKRMAQRWEPLTALNCSEIE